MNNKLHLQKVFRRRSKQSSASQKHASHTFGNGLHFRLFPYAF